LTVITESVITVTRTLSYTNGLVNQEFSLETDLPALLVFVVVTTFTPGPNNLASVSSGIAIGWRKTLPFTAGVFAGFVLVLGATATVSHFVLSTFPQLQVVLLIAGSLYIAYLAVRVFLSAVRISDQERGPLGFRDGFLLQPLNPKLIVYGLTLYGSFLGTTVSSVVGIALTAVAFATVAWLATMTWALAGTAVTRIVARPKILKAINAALALLLLYTAAELSGLFW
jgi:cysteine/O-acetylserine efflux protein